MVRVLAEEKVISNKWDANELGQREDAVVLAVHDTTHEAPRGATHPPQDFLCGGDAALRGGIAALGRVFSSS